MEAIAALEPDVSAVLQGISGVVSAPNLDIAFASASAAMAVKLHRPCAYRTRLSNLIVCTAEGCMG